MSTELRVEKLFSHKNTMLSNHNKNSSRNRNDGGKEHEEEGRRLETQLQHQFPVTQLFDDNMRSSLQVSQ